MASQSQCKSYFLSAGGGGEANAAACSRTLAARASGESSKGTRLCNSTLVRTNGTAIIRAASAKASGTDFFSGSPSVSPDAATKSGDGVVVVRFVPILLQFGEFSDKTLDVGFDWRWTVFIANLQYRAAHSAVLEHPAESRSLVGYAPVGDEVRYQEVERCIVRRGYGTPETRLLRVFSTPLRKVVCIPEQVIGICHLLRPCLFPRHGLLGFASEVGVWNHAKGVEIQVLGETPFHIVRHLAQAILCRIVGQHDPEEYGRSEERGGLGGGGA